MLGTAGEVGTNSSATFFYGLLFMLTDGEKESKGFVQLARLDHGDDDDDDDVPGKSNRPVHFEMTIV